MNYSVSGRAAGSAFRQPLTQQLICQLYARGQQRSKPVMSGKLVGGVMLSNKTQMGSCACTCCSIKRVGWWRKRNAEKWERIPEGLQLAPFLLCHKCTEKYTHGSFWVGKAITRTFAGLAMPNPALGELGLLWLREASMGRQSYTAAQGWSQLRCCICKMEGLSDMSTTARMQNGTNLSELWQALSDSPRTAKVNKNIAEFKLVLENRDLKSFPLGT